MCLYPLRMKTAAEEVWTLVQGWYFSRGRQVPEEEEKICKNEISKEAKERLQMEAFMTRSLLKDELEIETDYTQKAGILQGIAACDAMLKDSEIKKPTYGSNDFWKDYWAKKKANGWVPKAKKTN